VAFAYGAAVGTGAKGQQHLPGLHLSRALQRHTLVREGVCYNAAARACERGQQRQD